MNAMLPKVAGEDAGAALERVIIGGDLSKLSSQERITYYNAVCQSIGLNPLTRPLEYIRLSGKEVLYAKKDCTDQLRSLRRISVQVVSKEMDAGLIVVTARAVAADGRQDEDFGAVPLPSNGEARANAIMKAITKAKRRVTLSICGLGFLDESELDGIPAAERFVSNMAPPEPGTHAAAMAQLAPPTDDPLPMISPDGELIAVEAKGDHPAVTRWMSFCRKAVAKVGLDGREALQAWAREMHPHLVAIEPIEPEAVDAVRELIATKLEDLRRASEPQDEAAEA